MTELLDKLIAQAGLTPGQASKSLDVIKDFVKEKFPMLSGAVDNIFGSEMAAAAVTAAAVTEEKSGSWFDKISDIIPGDIGEKMESFAKKAADKAEDLYEKGKDTAEDLYDKGKDTASDLYEKGKDTASELYDKGKTKYDSFFDKDKEEKV